MRVWSTLLASLIAWTVALGPGGGESEPSLAGRLLVAEPELADPNFARTVVLLLHHDAEGAMGLVVNRRYGRVPMADLLRRLGRDTRGASGETELYYGGPVEPDVGTVLHDAGYRGSDTREIGAGLAATHDPAILEAMARRQGPRQARIVLGYAGWGPGQLESELAQGAWATIPADPELVLAPDPERVWERALARRGVDL